MKKMMKFVVIVAILFGGWALAAASLHVVRAPGTMAWGKIPLNVQLIPKNALTFRETYVDTTKWSVADVEAHRSFVDRLYQVKKQELVKQAEETPAPAHAKTPQSAGETPVSLQSDLPVSTTVAEAPKAASSTAKKAEPTSIFDFSSPKK